MNKTLFFIGVCWIAWLGLIASASATPVVKDIKKYDLQAESFPANYDLVCHFDKTKFRGTILISTFGLEAAFVENQNPDKLNLLETLNVEPKDCEGCFELLVRRDSGAQKDIYLLKVLARLNARTEKKIHFLAVDIYRDMNTSEELLTSTRCHENKLSQAELKASSSHFDVLP